MADRGRADRMLALRVSAGDVERLIMSCRRATVTGRRDYALLLGALACTPVSFLIDRLVPYLESREWEQRRHEAGGAEMYVHLARR